MEFPKSEGNNKPSRRNLARPWWQLNGRLGGLDDRNPWPRRSAKRATQCEKVPTGRQRTMHNSGYGITCRSIRTRRAGCVLVASTLVFGFRLAIMYPRDNLHLRAMLSVIGRIIVVLVDPEKGCRHLCWRDTQQNLLLSRDGDIEGELLRDGQWVWIGRGEEVLRVKLCKV